MSYFVRVSDASTVRRRILESSKDVLHVLKGYHRLLDIRDQKKETAEELRRVLAELSRLVERLDKLLPERSLKEIEEFLPKQKHAKKGAKKGKAPAPKKEPVSLPKLSEPKKKAPSELERLESALASIEERLGRL